MSTTELLEIVERQARALNRMLDNELHDREPRGEPD
jgi:hypothetical protein